MLESIVPEIRATNEPKQQECGESDYIITKKEIPGGFVETKKLLFSVKDKRIRKGGSGTSVFGIKINDLNISGEFLDFYNHIENPATK